MGTKIIKTNGSVLVEIPDATVNDDVCSIILVGKNLLDYGSYIETGIIRILENFSYNEAPLSPLEGQIWHNNSENKINFYNGTTWISILDKTDKDIYDSEIAQIEQEITSINGTLSVITEELQNKYATLDDLNSEISERKSVDTDMLSQITTEVSDRKSADNALELEKVNRSGDTMSGELTVNSNIISTGYIYAGADIDVGNGYSLFVKNSLGTVFGSTKINSDNGISWFIGSDPDVHTTEMTLNPDGSIITTKGTVAFLSDITHITTTITTSGNVGDANSYTIFKTVDTNMASGYRVRIVGQSPAFNGEGMQTINFPIKLNGIFPGSWGVSTYFQNYGNTQNHDSYMNVVTVPSLTSMILNCNGTYHGANEYPMYGMWWIEGW